MLKAIIIDDEQHCIDRIKNLLLAHTDSIYLVNAFTTIEEGAKAIAILHPDVVFLDVQINDKTGFDLLQTIPHPTFDVIFTTAYDRFAVQAFKCSAIDYLLKPIDPDELAAALHKLENKVSATQMKLKLDTLSENMNKLSGTKKIIVPSGNELLFIAVSDIIRCQSDINYTTIYLKDKQKIVVAKTLKDFEEMLNGQNFFRIHNSHLINMAYLKSYSKGKGGTTLLTDGTELEVSTRRKEEFLQKVAAL